MENRLNEVYDMFARLGMSEVKRPILENENNVAEFLSVDEKIKGIRMSLERKITNRNQMIFGFDVIDKVIEKLACKYIGIQYRNYTSLASNPWENCMWVLNDVGDENLKQHLSTNYCETHWGKELFSTEELTHIKNTLLKKGLDDKWVLFKTEYGAIHDYYRMTDTYKSLMKDIPSEILHQIVDFYLDILSQWLKEHKTKIEFYDTRHDRLNTQAITDYLADLVFSELKK